MWREVKTIIDVGRADLRLPPAPTCSIRIGPATLRRCCGTTWSGRIKSVQEYTPRVEDVPHRQVVFTIPQRLRVYFRYDHTLTGDLAGCAWRALRIWVLACLDDEAAIPGAVDFIQIPSFQPGAKLGLMACKDHLACLSSRIRESFAQSFFVGRWA